jgi:dihydrofolate synthase/folylpolyglutamate synthase
MAPLLDTVYTITPPDNPRALSAQKLAECMSKYHAQVEACQSLKEAVDKAYEQATEEDVVLIFGSLSYLGAIIKEVEAKNI